MQDGALIFDEELYKTGLTNDDISNELQHLRGKAEIVADSAEPKSIEELYRKNWMIK
jgi:phage terminase large subunit